MSDYTGQQFGNYRLLRLLGKGGFAHVYLGEHLHLGTQAAVKLLTTPLSEEEEKHFRDEARVMMELEHPHIARVLEFGLQDGIPFLVMAYAPKGCLRSMHPRGSRLPLAQVVSYVQQIAAALQVAHEADLIHRDVKPENVLVRQDGSLALSDFGIALVIQQSRALSTQQVIGTATYMAPEQFAGKPRRASDQYALGIMAYEWLTGAPPFRGTFAEIAGGHLSSPPPSLREQAVVKREVEEVIRKALAKDPRKRFASVQAFALALEKSSQRASTTLPAAPATTEIPSQQVARKRLVSPLSITAASGKERSVFRESPVPVSPARSRRDTRLGAASARPVKGEKRTRWWLRAGSLVLVLCMVFLCGSVMMSAATSLASSLSHAEAQLASDLQAQSDSSPAAASTRTADHFFSAVARQDYQQAYSDLGMALLLPLMQSDFTQLATHDDECYGPLIQYRQVASHELGETQEQLSYTVVRKKTTAYTLTLTFSQDGGSDKWLISHLGEINDLGPTPSTCS